MTPEQVDGRPCLSDLTAAELWQRAQEYRDKAATAADRDQRAAFGRLAWQYEKRAMEKRRMR